LARNFAWLSCPREFTPKISTPRFTASVQFSRNWQSWVVQVGVLSAG
jgi:hypothetical protein